MKGNYFRLVDKLSKIFGIIENTPIQKISDPILDENEINLFVKREDLNHPFLSGNKWHKLKYNLAEALENNIQTLLTFGGAYSNHIYSLAYAGKVLNLKTIGIIRGEEHLPLNPTLKFASEYGMELHYLNRSGYRKKTNAEYLKSLKNKFSDVYIIPEGGTNNLAVKGCSEIIRTIKIDFDLLCCPAGTGGTFAGLIAGLKGEKHLLGFSALKGGKFLNNDVVRLLENYEHNKYYNWEINLDYHFRGYAKYNRELISFMNNLSKSNNLILEPIYTGKMLYGLFDLIRNKKISERQTIVALHTGGMQGISGFKNLSEFNSSFIDFEVNR